MTDIQAFIEAEGRAEQVAEVQKRIEAEGIQSDGYVVDFGDIKKVARAVCKELNELFLCPEKSDVLDISVEGEDGGTLRIQCEDGAVRRPLQASGSSRQQPAAKGPCSCSRGACSAGVPFPAAGRSDAADQALDGGGAGALRLYAAEPHAGMHCAEP